MNDRRALAAALSLITRHLLEEEPQAEAEGGSAEGWLTLEKAAHHADVSVDTVRKWVDGGQLPAGRVGRVIRIRASDIDALLLGGARVDEAPLKAGEGGGEVSSRSLKILRAMREP